MSLPLRAEVVPLPTRRSAVRAALVSLRPRQWTKNLLVFAGIVFAGRLGDAASWSAAITAFAAYCAASSAAYLVNDLRDVRADRAHPIKRRRPIARGELHPRRAAALAASLAVAALVLAAALGPASALLALAFLALQALYTGRLRDVVLVDVIAIAGLFVIRAAAGAVAVDVRLSPWLLVCTGLLALLVALGKRRAEVVTAGASATRSTLARYPLPVLDQLLAAIAAATIAVYAIYTVAGRDSRALMVTIPLVVYGVLRYLLLVHRRGAGEDPENILLSDTPTVLTVVAWAVTCATVVALLAPATRGG